MAYNTWSYDLIKYQLANASVCSLSKVLRQVRMAEILPTVKVPKAIITVRDKVQLKWHTTCRCGQCSSNLCFFKCKETAVLTIWVVQRECVCLFFYPWIHFLLKMASFHCFFVGEKQLVVLLSRKKAVQELQQFSPPPFLCFPLLAVFHSERAGGTLHTTAWFNMAWPSDQHY